MATQHEVICQQNAFTVSGADGHVVYHHRSALGLIYLDVFDVRSGSGVPSCVQP